MSTALAVEIDPEVQEAMTAALTMPQSFAYWGDRPLGETWGFVTIGRHRDSDALQRSNFEVVSEDLLERFPEQLEIMHTSHCLVGWYDHLIVHVRDEQSGAPTEAFLAAHEWMKGLEEYPIASEDHYGRLESEEEWEWFTHCLQRVEDLLPESQLPEDYQERILREANGDNGSSFDEDDVQLAATRLGFTESSVPCPHTAMTPIEGQLTLIQMPAATCRRCWGTGFVVREQTGDADEFGLALWQLTFDD